MDCQHLKRRVREPEVKDACVNIEEFCEDCGVRLSVVSWQKDEWIHRQMKAITEFTQTALKYD